MLYSRLNSLKQMYTFSNLSSDSTVLTASSDPTLLDLATDGTSHIIQTIMEPCPFEGDASLNLPGLGRSYFARGLQFYKLFMLQSDLSMHEIIVYAQLGEHSNSTEQCDAVQEISWTTVYPRRRDGRTIRSNREMDDFLELPGIDALQHPMPKLPLRSSPWLQRKPTDEAHRIVDQRLIYDILTRPELEREAPTATIDIPVVINQLKQLLAGHPYPAQLPLGTL
jgi:RNA polymerase I-specific transcription initiation factor RRN6